MTCRTCGTTIGPQDEVCPCCGAPVEREVIDEPAEERSAAARPSVADKYKKAPLSTGGLPKDLIIIAAVALCLILSVISLISAGAKGKDSGEVTALRQELDTVKTTVNSMYDQISSLENQVSSLMAANQTLQSQIGPKITMQPTDEVAAIGRTDVWVFSIVGKGTSISFQWQKYNTTTATWDNVLVADTDDGYDVVFVEVAAGTQAKLFANYISAGTFGKYRCIVTDGDGLSVTSAEINLTEGIPD